MPCATNAVLSRRVCRVVATRQAQWDRELSPASAGLFRAGWVFVRHRNQWLGSALRRWLAADVGRPVPVILPGVRFQVASHRPVTTSPAPPAGLFLCSVSLGAVQPTGAARGGESGFNDLKPEPLLLRHWRRHNPVLPFLFVVCSDRGASVVKHECKRLQPASGGVGQKRRLRVCTRFLLNPVQGEGPLHSHLQDRTAG